MEHYSNMANSINRLVVDPSSMEEYKLIFLKKLYPCNVSITQITLGAEAIKGLMVIIEN